MPDETQPTGQAPTGQQPQAGNAATDQNTQTQQQSGSQTSQAGADAGQQQQGSGQNGQQASGDDLKALVERLQRELGDVRKEAAGHRTKAKELDKLREEAETAKLGDVEKARKRAEQAEAAVNAARARIGKSELKLAAKEAGIIDPDDAIAHLGGKLEFDDDGEPKNVAELVSALKASKAHLFKSADGANGSGSQSGQQNGSTQKPASTSGGATNPPRAGGPQVITANQYMDKAFQTQFKTQHGMDVFTALKTGKITVA